MSMAPDRRPGYDVPTGTIQQWAQAWLTPSPGRIRTCATRRNRQATIMAQEVDDGEVLNRVDERSARIGIATPPRHAGTLSRVRAAVDARYRRPNRSGV